MRKLFRCQCGNLSSYLKTGRHVYIYVRFLYSESFIMIRKNAAVCGIFVRLQLLSPTHYSSFFYPQKKIMKSVSRYHGNFSVYYLFGRKSILCLSRRISVCFLYVFCLSGEKFSIKPCKKRSMRLFVLF